MDYATALYGILSLYFTGNKVRVVCMTNLLIGLLRAASTNLHKVECNMPDGTKIKSKYRRAQRFFYKVQLEWDLLAAFIINQISMHTKYIVIIDRTNWKFGMVDINFLVLSIAWHGISIPIYWVNFAKAGNSNTEERMQVLSKEIRLLGADKIEALLADREFVGEDWLHWLDYYGIKFVIRIKDNSQLYHNKRYSKAIKSFRTLSRGHTRCISCTLWGLCLTVVGYKDKNGKVHILATNGAPNRAVEFYAIR